MLIDLTGKRFGRLTVLKLATSQPPHAWRCRCDCGTERTINGASLRHGRTQSCGCIRSETSRAHCRSMATHDASHTSTYKTWQSMKNRCFNPRATEFKYYGGRDIRVCRRWMTFENFLSDMGPRPEGMTIERNDNAGNYTPKNCRWATKLEQANNRRCTTVLTIDGVTRALGEWWMLPIRIGTRTMTLQEWAAESGLSQQLVQLRASRGKTTLLQLLAPHRSLR